MADDRNRNRQPAADDTGDDTGTGPDDIPVTRLAAKFGWERGDVEVTRPGESGRKSAPFRPISLIGWPVPLADDDQTHD